MALLASTYSSSPSSSSDGYSTNLAAGNKADKTIALAPPGAKHTKKGRGDIRVNPGNPEYVVVVEIKNTDCDKVKHPKKLSGAHRRQLWKYIDPIVEDGVDVVAGL